MSSLITEFISDTESLLHSMQSSLAASDYAAFHEHAHAIKGSSGSIGAIRLYEICKEINESCTATTDNINNDPTTPKPNPAPRYGGLVPPLGPTLRAALTVGDCTHPLVSLRERSLTIAWSRPECRQASLTPDWRLSRRPLYPLGLSMIFKN